MATSQKVTALAAATTILGTDLLYIVHDPIGVPTSQKSTIKQTLEANVTANVVANGSLVMVGTASANAFVHNYTATPANSTNVPAGFAINTMWADANFIYIVTGASALKRVAIATW